MNQELPAPISAPSLCPPSTVHRLPSTVYRPPTSRSPLKRWGERPREPLGLTSDLRPLTSGSSPTLYRPLFPTPSSKLPAPCSLLTPFPIAGFRYYDGDRQLSDLVPGTRLALRAEPANPHDPFAVEILYGPVKLGYVPRFCNRRVSQLLLEAVPITCQVEHVDPEAPPWESVSVRLHLPNSDLEPLNLEL